MNCIQLITDKERKLFKTKVFRAPERMPAVKQLLSCGSGFSGFLGMGVALTGSSCYLLNEMQPDERRELLTRLYSKDGLNMSVARLSIGSSDYSAELYSYDDVPFDRELCHFSVERDEKYIIPMIREVLAVRPDLYIFASPWSPPGWMKTGGLLCGGYMRKEFVDCYADYIIKYIKAYAGHGIKISAITPQNEPNVTHNGKMPGCLWHPEIEAEFIQLLKQKLRASGLDVKVWMHDHNFDDVITRAKWELDNIAGLKDNVDGVALHYYSGNIENTSELSLAYPDKPLHFTEGGPRLYDNYATDHCKWATMIIKALMCGVRSFTGWNLMLDETGNPNIGPFGCGGFVTRNSVSYELSFSGQHNAYAHFAPFITKESVICPLKVGDGFGRNMSKYPAFTHPPIGISIDDAAAVVVNGNSEKMQLQFTLGGTQYYAELPPDSISTFILKI